MIASLRGTLAERDAATCVIEAAGVGYLVHVSLHTARSLPELGSEIWLRTRQVVREDSLTLFGFTDTGEMKLFDMLITVSGVGPKLAMAVLSGLPSDKLMRAIKEENVGALVAIPGVGKRTAERLVVELRDKLDVAPVAAAKKKAKEKGVLPKQERFEDAVAALTRLGYTPAEAKTAVQKVADTEDTLSLEDIVRRSLATLGKQPAGAR